MSPISTGVTNNFRKSQAAEKLILVLSLEINNSRTTIPESVRLLTLTARCGALGYPGPGAADSPGEACTGPPDSGAITFQIQEDLLAGLGEEEPLDPSPVCHSSYGDFRCCPHFLFSEFVLWTFVLPLGRKQITSQTFGA